ncbi:MAG: DUF1538 domain-containing protein [Bacilli bacterium]|jgi:hypothetical protein
MQWLLKFKDSLLSVLPIFVIVLLLNFTGLSPLSINETIAFSVSCVLIVFGMGLFTNGTETSISKIGEYVGSSITKRKSLILIIFLFFLLGIFITIAEPALSVLAEQVPINKWLFIVCVGLGVGFFLLIGVLRILFRKSLKLWLLAFYGLLFALACLVDKSFIPISFDAGGVATGPLTVPFIMAIGIGISSSRAGEHSDSDSFGLTALCSIGPIITVMIFSMLMDKSQLNYTFELNSIGDNLFQAYLYGFGNAAFQALLSILPIMVFFIIYQAIFIKLPAKTILKILIGLIYTYSGLVVFLTAVQVGFLPIGKSIGMDLGQNGNAMWLLPLIGFFLGLFTVLVEPAVPILISQVQNVSDGAIKKRPIFIALCTGVASAVCLSMVRICFHIPLIYFLVPGYALAMFLSFFVSDIYTAVAFDAGTVASGVMNTTFILPFAVGACYVLNGTEQSSSAIMSDAFGIVSLVTLAPIISMQIIGLDSTIKRRIALKNARYRIREENDAQIIHFE